MKIILRTILRILIITTEIMYVVLVASVSVLLCVQCSCVNVLILFVL